MENSWTAKFKNWKLPILILVFLVIGGLVWSIQPPKMTTPKQISSSASQEQNVEIVVDFAGQKPNVAKSLKLNQGESALTLLKNNFVVETVHYSFGDLVTGVDGVKADKANFWLYYVNDKQPTVGAGDYVLSSNDKIRFVLEKESSLKQ